MQKENNKYYEKSYFEKHDLADTFAEWISGENNLQMIPRLKFHK